MPCTCSDIFKIICAVIFPVSFLKEILQKYFKFKPLGVLVEKGCSIHLLINMFVNFLINTVKPLCKIHPILGVS